MAEAVSGGWDRCGVAHVASSRAFPLSDTLSTLSSASRLLSLPLLNLLDPALTPKPSVSDLGWASSKCFSCSATRTCSSPSSFLGVDVAQTPSRSAVNHFLPAANTAVVLGRVTFFPALAIRLGARVLAPAVMLVDLDIAALITAVPLDVVATTFTKALQNMQGPH
ncbi:hypothetical protein B0H12DRAFT_1243327 [Mycena haematopus]|nr:hypothetical protein B0H12DRAFT_1243327 [Mycena haematopus]